MTEAVKHLKSVVSSLSEAERAELADFLLSTLPEDEGEDEAWQAEISRRVAEIRAGTAKEIPYEDVMAELKELYP
jgi:putative addiction module component (TIGR02574 family)